MRVRKSDVMLLEAYLRRASRAMSPKLICHSGTNNSPHENPVQVTWGSNSFRVDRDDLYPLLDALDPDNEITPNGFLKDLWIPFLTKHADK